MSMRSIAEFKDFMCQKAHVGETNQLLELIPPGNDDVVKMLINFQENLGRLWIKKGVDQRTTGNIYRVPIIDDDEWEDLQTKFLVILRTINAAQKRRSGHE